MKKNIVLMAIATLLFSIGMVSYAALMRNPSSQSTISQVRKAATDMEDITEKYIKDEEAKYYTHIEKMADFIFDKIDSDKSKRYIYGTYIEMAFHKYVQSLSRHLLHQLAQ